MAAAQPFANALEAQIGRATLQLEMKLRELRGDLQKAPPQRTPHSTVFIKLVRYLDLTWKGKLGPTDALRVLKGRKDIERDERRDTPAQAKKYLDDYLVIALMKTTQMGAIKAR